MRSPVQINENVWIVDGPVVRWFTMPFPTRMVICHLGGGELFILTPIKLNPQMTAFLAELGDDPDPAWAQEIDQLIFKGSRVLDEVVFLHSFFWRAINLGRNQRSGIRFRSFFAVISHQKMINN